MSDAIFLMKKTMTKDIKQFSDSAYNYLLSYVVMLAGVLITAVITGIYAAKGMDVPAAKGLVTNIVNIVAIVIQYFAVKGIRNSVHDNDVPAADLMLYSVYVGILSEIIDLLFSLFVDNVGLAITIIIAIIEGIVELGSYVLIIIAFSKFKKSPTFPSPEGASQGMTGYIIIAAGQVLTMTILGACIGIPAAITGFIFVILAWLKLKESVYNNMGR